MNSTKHDAGVPATDLGMAPERVMGLIFANSRRRLLVDLFRGVLSLLKVAEACEQMLNAFHPDTTLPLGTRGELRDLTNSGWLLLLLGHRYLDPHGLIGLIRVLGDSKRVICDVSSSRLPTQGSNSLAKIEFKEALCRK